MEPHANSPDESVLFALFRGRTAFGWEKCVLFRGGLSLGVGFMPKPQFDLILVGC